MRVKITPPGKAHTEGCAGLKKKKKKKKPGRHNTLPAPSQQRERRRREANTAVRHAI